MAFNDNPQVDANAVKSERSVLAVRNVLTQDNGFISREEHPDYGVDLDVELMSAQGASSQKFAVQIKSVKEVTLVKLDGEEFISYSFKTSRLGYICRRPPGFGLIVLYDDLTHTAYYDYLVDIIPRIDQFNGKDWRDQANVQIYLPPQRVFNQAAAAEIHATVADLHARFARLAQEQGHLYRLPQFGLAAAAGPVPAIDFHNLTQVAHLLEEHGAALFNQQEYAMLLDLLGRLPGRTVADSAPLSFLAAVTYGQTGELLEGDYYIAKCLQTSEAYDAEAIALLNMAKIRLDFVRGALDLPAYGTRLEELTAAVVSPLNRLVLRINRLYLEAIAQTSLQESEPASAAQVEALFAEIAVTPLDQEEQLLLNLYATDVLQVYVSNRYLQNGWRYKLREQVGSPVPLVQRQADGRVLIGWMQQVARHLQAAHDYAKAHNKRYLLACAQQYSSRFFLTIEFDSMLLTLDEPATLQATTAQQFQHNLALANEAFHALRELQLRQDAYQTVVIIHELQALYELRYQRALSTTPLERTKVILRELGQKVGQPAFQSAVEQAHRGLTALHQAPTRDGWAAIQEEDVAGYAQLIMQAHQLPPECLPHVLAEVENHRLFEAACQDRAVELLSETQLPGSAFTRPPTFILRNRVTGVETSPFTDVRTMLPLLQTTLRTPPSPEPTSQPVPPGATDLPA
jgi:hypothetical protein